MENQSIERESTGTNWPELDYKLCRDTYASLHRWIQIVGKIKMARSPWTNHSWHTTLRVTPTGLTTLPFDANGKSVSIDLDFIDHTIKFSDSSGIKISEVLRSEPVKDFYGKVKRIMEFLGIEANFDLYPSEIPDSLAFDKDTVNRTYNPFHAADFWQALSAIDLIFQEFRAGFSGKSSPVQFFWGSFDLAVTRFSGREAPEHPGGIPNLPDLVAREAYSHEVVSFGFFPGNETYPKAAFYSYAYPEPPGFSAITDLPGSGFYHTEMGEYLLPYEDVRRCSNPKTMIFEFFNATYEAAVKFGNWEREKLEPGKYLKKLQVERNRQFLH